MTIRQTIKNLLNQEDLNFLLTNRLPRKWLTEFMGRFSKIEQPLVRDASIAIWKYFSDLDLSEAKKTRFTSMHDCFTRELKDGARPINMDVAIMSSPVDAYEVNCSVKIVREEHTLCRNFFLRRHLQHDRHSRVHRLAFREQSLEAVRQTADTYVARASGAIDSDTSMSLPDATHEDVAGTMSSNPVDDHA